METNEKKRTPFAAFLSHYAHRVNSVAFVGGFIFDLFTLPPIERFATHIVIAAYLIFVAMAITLLQLVEERRIKHAGTPSRTETFLPLAIQFAFGALFSALFVLYFRGASLAGSWPFLLVLAAMLVGNELLKKRWARLELQLVAFFFTLMLSAVLYVPVITSDISQRAFLVAGAIAVFVFASYTIALLLIAREATKRSVLAAFIGAIVFYLAINVLYFTNLIPPIPLSLRDAVVAHNVERTPLGDYRVTYEPQTLAERFGSKARYHHKAGEPAYIYTSVYAPISIQTPIIHEWQAYDDERDEWITKNRVEFPISGGREGGYRAYSLKGVLEPGAWRVLVKTGSGAWLGAKRFDVVLSTQIAELYEKTF